MKFEETFKKESPELHEMLKELRLKLGSLRFQKVGTSLKDHSQFKKLKKDIARVMTRLQQQMK